MSWLLSGDPVRDDPSMVDDVCRECGGLGDFDDECEECEGEGCEGCGGYGGFTRDCPECGGSGVIQIPEE